MASTESSSKSGLSKIGGAIKNVGQFVGDTIAPLSTIDPAFGAVQDLISDSPREKSQRRLLELQQIRLDAAKRQNSDQSIAAKELARQNAATRDKLATDRAKVLNSTESLNRLRNMGRNGEQKAALELSSSQRREKEAISSVEAAKSRARVNAAMNGAASKVAGFTTAQVGRTSKDKKTAALIGDNVLTNKEQVQIAKSERGVALQSWMASLPILLALRNNPGDKDAINDLNTLGDLSGLSFHRENGKLFVAVPQLQGVEGFSGQRGGVEVNEANVRRLGDIAQSQYRDLVNSKQRVKAGREFLLGNSVEQAMLPFMTTAGLDYTGSESAALKLVKGMNALDRDDFQLGMAVTRLLSDKDVTTDDYLLFEQQTEGLAKKIGIDFMRTPEGVVVRNEDGSLDDIADWLEKFKASAPAFIRFNSILDALAPKDTGPSIREQELALAIRRQNLAEEKFKAGGSTSDDKAKKVAEIIKGKGKGK